VVRLLPDESLPAAHRRILGAIDFFRRPSEKVGGSSTFFDAPQSFSDTPQILLTGHRKRRRLAIFFRRATENGDGPLEESERHPEKVGGSQKKATRHRFFRRPIRRI